MRIITEHSLRFLAALSAACLSACSPSLGTIAQFGTMDALMAGAYDGVFSCSHLAESGDSGLGTFDRLDGEMIVLEGEIYQVQADGRVYPKEADCSAPYALLVAFQPDITLELPSTVSKSDLDALLSENCRGDRVCSVKLHGRFARVKTRSVPAQNKPYPPLLDAIKDQSVFDMNDIEGTLIGFRSPAFFNGITAAGNHFHFLSDRRDSGGHLLDFELKSGVLEIDNCDVFEIVFPDVETAQKSPRATALEAGMQEL